MLVTFTIWLLLSELYSNEYNITDIWNHVSCIRWSVHNFQSPLNVGHLNIPSRFSMESQATHRFLLVSMPETGYYKIYLA